MTSRQNGVFPGSPGESVEAVLRRVPGVTDAAVIAEDRSQAPHIAPRPPAPSGPRPPSIAHGTPLRLPEGAPDTLQGALLRAAAHAPEKGVTYLLPGGGQDRQTYARLLDDGLRTLGGLRESGLRPGDSVLLQCADSRTFVTAFWACVLGGILPTPVGPAPGYARDNAVTRKLRSAWRLLDRCLIVTDDELRDQVQGLGALWDEPALRVAAVTELAAGLPADPAAVTADDPVLNLLTSGSTGIPKCVHHANRSIVNRTFATIAANGFTEDEISLNWMPLDHVGGIVMYNVRDAFLACEHVNARTDAFVQRPLNWLDWIHRFRATNTWAPNFAFALLNEFAHDIGAGSWDLSCMRNICNAGEAVVARTAHRCLELLEPHGLPADAMVPCWGMSETSSGVTYSRMRRHEPVIGTHCVDARSLTSEPVDVPHGTPDSVVLTEVGPPIAGVSLRIVDDAGAVVPEGRVGRLHITGATLLKEYYRNPEANAAAFTSDGWFDTGDLGLIRDGRLTLTGRAKDLIVVNGANFPAHELESVVGQVSGVRATFAAVLGVPDPDLGTDGVVVFFVPEEGMRGRTGEVIAEVRTSLARETGLQPRTIVPLEPAEFPKTASGKIQRGRLLEDLHAGRYDERLRRLLAEQAPVADPWLFAREWGPVSGTAIGADPADVLVYGEPDLAAAVHRVTGAKVTAFRRGASFRPGHDEIVIDPLDLDQHRRALDMIAARPGGIPAHVLYAWDAVAAEGDADPEIPAVRLLTAVQALAGARRDVTLGVLTRGAVAARSGDPVDPGRAALTALVRTAVAEETFASACLIDLPAAGPPDEAIRWALAPAGRAEEITALRDGTLWAPRLRPVGGDGRIGIPKSMLAPGGTVLVTGGLGGIGRTIVPYLLAAMQARVLLVGRTPESEFDAGRSAALAEVRALGECQYVAVDVADAPALAAAVRRAEAGWGQPLDLVLHLAGADLRDQWRDLSRHLLVAERAEHMRRMLRPKLGGAGSLDALLATRPRLAVVLFSSVNGLLGGASFGAYAAANAALDGFADRWAAGGREVRCLAWSMWAGVGMNAGSPLEAAARHRGLRVIAPSRGLALLLSALHQDRNYLFVGADPDNEHMRPFLTAPDVLVAVVPDGSVGDAELRSGVAAALAGSPLAGSARIVPVHRIPRGPDGQVDVAALLTMEASVSAPHVPPEGEPESEIARIWREVVGVDAVGRDDSFFGIGGNSIKAMQTIDRINEAMGGDHPVSVLYEHPTLRELAAALVGGGEPVTE
jgi:acyl-CoA synthetase (AMP-forming)/AMP-acid ligase II/NAD(P)-dependent dehydrogenase (short-subunit alcohol dehydrogenase family)